MAPNLLSGMDAQVWVDKLRDEWDEREPYARKRLFNLVAAVFLQHNTGSYIAL
ncbi:hypothetical protein NIES4071_98310 [Calothrix sp. NIES-4071]|nr:hypothetical protein NIES4071_98310 [Calothrix sp. NIES-4071]BAZ64095.1 hypothetical protein NIES4105_98240 [Calothrix sp. NIES-4105]